MVPDTNEDEVIFAPKHGDFIIPHHHRLLLTLKDTLSFAHMLATFATKLQHTSKQNQIATNVHFFPWGTLAKVHTYVAPFQNSPKCPIQIYHANKEKTQWQYPDEVVSQFPSLIRLAQMMVLKSKFSPLLPVSPSSSCWTLHKLSILWMLTENISYKPLMHK